MLRSPVRQNRAGEGGQTLILALAFIAMFGLVVGAVLGVAGVTGLQHAHTEATAASDSRSEGGAAFAAADAGRSDLSLSCSPANTGQLTMQNNDSVGYKVNTCNPGLAQTNGAGPGLNCLLCVLNLVPSPTSATADVLSLQCAQCDGADLTTNGGDDYINGSVRGNSSITASPAGAHIRILSGARTCGGCSPAPTTTNGGYYAPAIPDPLAALGAPSPAVTNEPQGCTAQGSGMWNSSNGCSESLAGMGTFTIYPGLWASLNVSGKAQITMAAGVYVFTNALSASGNEATIGGAGVTIFLTCANYGASSNGRLCPTSGQSGASVSFSGKTTANFSAPTTGTYGNVAVLADPHLLDPGGVAACSGGDGCVYEAGGQGAAIAGTVDTRSGGVAVEGNGNATIAGRLIANTLYMSVSGHVENGLSVSGPGRPDSPSSCGVFDDDTLSGTTGALSTTGRAIIQSQCGGGTLSGVVDFNYKP